MPIKNTLLSKKYFKILFFSTAFIIFILAMVSNDHITLNSNYADKIKHISAFFTLSLLLNRSSSSIERRLRNMVALLFFGILIEVVQFFIPSRDADINDIIADFVGILLFQLSYSFLKFIQHLIKIQKKRL
jgi:VanZ family protein